MIKALQILGCSSGFISQRLKKPHSGNGLSLISSKISYNSTPKSLSFRVIQMFSTQSQSNSDAPSSSSVAVHSAGNVLKIKFCQWCGGPAKHEIPDGEEKIRAICTLCGKLAYQNPKMHCCGGLANTTEGKSKREEKRKKENTMFRARSACARFSTQFKIRPFCSTTKDSKNNKTSNSDIVDGKIESNLNTFNESYRQLDNLNFMTAAKILFTQPPKKKKFGIDFHLVQLFFACLPSLAVYLVAQYARYEMRKMEAELEEKKKQEEAKRKQEEERDKEEQIATDPELSEVKVRLGKLEEAIKEIAAESKKQSAPNVTKTQKNASELGEDRNKSESSSSVMQDEVTKQKSVEQVPYADPGKARSVSPDSDASRKDQKGENRIGGTSQDAKR